MRAVKKRGKREEIDERETEFYLNDRESFRTLAQMARIVQTELYRSRRGSWILSERENSYFKTANIYICINISLCNKRTEYVRSLKIKIVKYKSCDFYSSNRGGQVHFPSFSAA